MESTMGRLRELNDVIIRVAEEKDATRLVGTWLPNQIAHMDGKSTGTEAGTRNCSLIAQFVCAFYLRQRGFQPKPRSLKPVKCETFGLKKYAKDSSALYVMAGGHDFAIVCEGNEYGLYQAWEGEFHVFPLLNDDRESHNIFGMGEDTIKTIDNEVARIARKVNEADGARETDGDVGTPGTFDVQVYS